MLIVVIKPDKKSDFKEEFIVITWFIIKFIESIAINIVINTIVIGHDLSFRSPQPPLIRGASQKLLC